jgi:hypothetical protein
MITALFVVLCSLFSTVSAQTFTQRVQQSSQGEGTVTIHHDKAIDDLVNGQTTTAAPKTPRTTTPVKTGAAVKDDKHTKPASSQQQQQQQPAATQATTTETPDSVVVPAGPRRTYKTTGYRVQAFAGGNTRSDRQRAEQTGNTLRQLFPGEEVYVHFYSPRWICRLGNYRTYQEAREKMLEVRKMGYESATVVKGKITLTY